MHDQTGIEVMNAEPVISLRSYGGEVCHHRHAFHQFVLPLRGRLELDTHAGARCVDAATALLIPANEDHCFRAAGDNRFAVVDVADDHPLCERAQREPAFAVSPALTHQLAQLEWCTANGGLSARFRHHWTALLFETLAGDGAPAADAASRRFEFALARIRTGRVNSVADLAAQAGLSVARVHALFRRHAGTTPGECLLRARLERGATMLATSDRPIADIALDCGFSEHSAFTRAFRRVYGMSPSGYRRRVRGTRD
ncbi:MAG: AraC family transcriptional regulator [Halofilum sp. (in: g-proteobacteria)]|nr:AraC family transcriptional regulator [Halofilum sp. (in: g-proteobacteria)]